MSPGGEHGSASSCAGLVVELAGLPDVVARLLEQHQPDAAGRCRACTCPGTGEPHAEWPCALHFYAAAARDLTARARPLLDIIAGGL